MRDTELLEQYERDLEMLTRVSNALPGALREAAELSSPIRAASYDDVIVTGGRSVIWCWTHEADVKACRHGGMDCGGEPISIGGDPTGEAAIMPGRVKIARQRIEAAFRAIHNAVPGLVAEVAWLTRTPETNAQARKREDERQRRAEDNDLGGLDHKHGTSTMRCRCCANTYSSPGQRRAEPFYKRRVVGDESVPLCQWCYDFSRPIPRGAGRLPTTEECERRHDKRRVYKQTG